jgi:Family of unknown function (DUF6082)
VTLAAKVTTRGAIGASLLALTVAVLVAVVMSPIGLSWISTWTDGESRNEQWQLLSNVGQAYGGISAVIAGVALLAVASSLLMQARQTRIAQIQSMRYLQVELFRMAYEYPDLQEGWSRSIDFPYPEWRKRTYMNLVFQYLRMGFEVGDMSQASLERTLTNRFRTQFGRDYWSVAGERFQIDAAGNRKSRRFYKTAQKVYEQALSEPPLPEPPAPPDPDPEDAPAPEPTRGVGTHWREVGVGVLLGLAIATIRRPRA